MCTGNSRHSRNGSLHILFCRRRILLEQEAPPLRSEEKGKAITQFADSFCTRVLTSPTISCPGVNGILAIFCATVQKKERVGRKEGEIKMSLLEPRLLIYLLPTDRAQYRSRIAPPCRLSPAIRLLRVWAQARLCTHTRRLDAPLRGPSSLPVDP